MNELFLSSRSRLSPSNAVAAILVQEDGRYLLQRRDPKPTIWYPDHWGLFGGGVETGEDNVTALKRELIEEISWTPDTVTYFTNFDFDFGFAGASRCYRTFYVGVIPSAIVPRLVLREGAAVESFTIEQIFALTRVVPYDSFALWLHHSRERITG